MATVALSRPAVPWFAAPVVLCALMLFVSGTVWSIGGSSPIGLIWPYVSAAFAACVTSALVFAFVEIWKLAKVRADNPLQTVFARLRPKLPILAIPAFILPLFLAGYTSVKASIPATVGYRYDAVFANMDVAVFGADPWQLTHSYIGPLPTLLIEFFYVPVWIAALAYTKALVGLFAERRLAITFYTASLMTWLLGGFVCAYLLSAAGPTFIDLNGMEMRFVALRAHMLEIAGMDTPFITGPAYLEAGMLSGETYRGGGISAMPSMHIAACTIYCLASRGTRWFYPALAFLGIIFIGSVHSGYHYAVDAPVAALIAYLCWKVAAALYMPVEAYDRSIDKGVGRWENVNLGDRCG